MSSAGSNGEQRSNRHACAACKYQRRRCTEQCNLYPYFPIDKAGDFQPAQRVFGISNMIRIIKELPVQDRENAVNSFVWEGKAWQEDPVNGPLGLYRRLQEENELLKSLLMQKGKQQIMQHYRVNGYNNPVQTIGVVNRIAPNNNYNNGYNKENMSNYPSLIGALAYPSQGRDSPIRQSSPMTQQANGNGNQTKVSYNCPMTQIPYFPQTMAQEPQNFDVPANHQLSSFRHDQTTGNPNSVNGQLSLLGCFHESELPKVVAAPNMRQADVLSRRCYLGHIGAHPAFQQQPQNNGQTDTIGQDPFNHPNGKKMEANQFSQRDQFKYQDNGRDQLG